MSKISEKMERLTKGIIAKNEERKDTIKAEAIVETEKKASIGPKTGPGVFMNATFGREAAEEAKAEAERALNELKQSRIVNIADLVEIPERKRILKPEAFEELKKNLSSYRLVNPITIRNHSQGGYEIVAGHNRVQAYRELGRISIEANLLEFDDSEVLSAAFYTNLFSPALTHYEQFKGFSALQELTGKSSSSIAEESGLSKTHISHILSYDGLPEHSISLLEIKPWILGASMAARFVILVKAGMTERVNRAVEKLFENEKFTEKAALAFITEKPNNKIIGRTENIKIGQNKFASVTTRKGVITLKLEDITNDEIWSKKIINFVRSELKK